MKFLLLTLFGLTTSLTLAQIVQTIPVDRSDLSAETAARIAADATKQPLDADLTSLSSPGTGVVAALQTNIGSAGSVITNGGAGGTPLSIVLTNGTGLPVSTGISGLGTGVADFLATPSASNFAAAVTGETGTGAPVLGTSPTITTPTISAPLMTGHVTFSPSNTYNVGNSAFNASPAQIYAQTGFHVPSGQFYNIVGTGTISGATDGVFRFKNVAGTDGVGSIVLGGENVGAARLKANGTEWQFKTGNDASYGSGRAGAFSINTGTTSKVSRVGGKIKEYFTDAGNTGTSETDLYTYTTEAGLLANNGETITGNYAGEFVTSGGTATRQVKLYFGGTAFFDSGALTVSEATDWSLRYTLIRVSSTAVRYEVTFLSGGLSSLIPPSGGEITGLTLSNTNILKITGTAAGVGAATNDITAKLGSIFWWPASL
jgi:hypothetical protein